MDTHISTWEMNLHQVPIVITEEEIATGPTEPYTLDKDGFNWN